MSIFREILKAAAVPVTENPGDYRDDNGLLHCGICGKPKQMIAPEEVADIAPILTVQCDCQEAQSQRAEDQQKKLRKRMLADETMRILEDLGACGFPRDVFSSDDGGDAETRSKAIAYVNGFEKARGAALGLMFVGPVGSGKTFWTSCIASQLIEDGMMVMFTDLRRLVNAANDKNGENRKYILRSVRGCDLLVLDDLGVERESSFMAEQVFQIIDERYQAKRPMIITSNLDPSMMAKATEPGEARIYQRILERCKIIQVSAIKRRSANAAKNSAIWKEILAESEEKNQ